ncbi:MAG: glycosyltransferase [Rhodospirillaceae bacterium]|nr:glycosyltransferase [Rhodospirillaceae bacterium]
MRVGGVANRTRCRSVSSPDWLLGGAVLSLAVWLVLINLRSRFWLADQRLGEAAELDKWPTVTAVIPARNEAVTIGATVDSLLRQDYPGDFRVIVVDDNSDDGTAEVSRPGGIADRLSVISGRPLVAGWAGKLWAVSQGIDAVPPQTGYVLLTDADIEHDPGNLKRLVYKAETERLHLVSLMVKLRSESFWESLLIPAFVFFFQKLYPFPAVNDPTKKIAAAAGGCMLVRRETLVQAGGIEAIHDQVIDDCAMARLIKPLGGIWLGLATRTRSLRAYESLSEIWGMVARTAFVQLNHSVWMLIGTVLGMVVIYLVPLGAVVMGLALERTDLMLVGGGGWLIMVAAYAPTLALYGQFAIRGIFLPFAATLYTLMTISSALRHWRGQGAAWKGRHYG